MTNPTLTWKNSGYKVDGSRLPSKSSTSRKRSHSSSRYSTDSSFLFKAGTQLSLGKVISSSLSDEEALSSASSNQILFILSSLDVPTEMFFCGRLVFLLYFGFLVYTSINSRKSLSYEDEDVLLCFTYNSRNQIRRNRKSHSFLVYT